MFVLGQRDHKDLFLAQSIGKHVPNESPYLKCRRPYSNITILPLVARTLEMGLIERLFGTTTTELLHQLSGNTQATKHPRQMTREVDPRRLAVWTLERF